MSKIVNKKAAKLRRVARVRSKVEGTAARPRLTVYKSNRFIFAQVIDDTVGKTLVSCHSKSLPKAPKAEQSLAVGEAVAKKAKAAGIDKVVFDRAGNRYHGRVKAVADGARQGGLDF